MVDFLQNIVTGIALGCVYALAGLGFVLIYKSSRVLNFSQGQFIAIGAFLVFALAVWYGLPIWLAAFLAMLLSAGFGFLIERVFLRRMVGQPIIAVIMVTIALASVLDGLMYLTPFGAGSFSLPQFLPHGGLVLGGIIISYPHLLAFGFTVVFLVLFGWFFQRSVLGISMRAVADDQMASMSLGISVQKVFALAWVVAGLTAAAAGFVVASITGLHKDALVAIGLLVFPAVILGGLDSPPGAVVGGMIIGILQSFSTFYLDGPLAQIGLVGGGSHFVVPFLVLLVMLWFKPHGLFGTEEIERV